MFVVPRALFLPLATWELYKSLLAILHRGSFRTQHGRNQFELHQMCGPETPRVTLPGAAMAALFKDRIFLAYVFFEDLRSGHTAITLKAGEKMRENPDILSQASEVRIHQYGQLLKDPGNAVIHRSPVSVNGEQCGCLTKLVVTTGKMGIIGRGISISDRNDDVLASGVIGWN